MKNKNVFREKIRRAAVPAVLCVLLTVSALLLCACREDGGRTPGLAEFLLLSIVTCGIYTLFWMYDLGNRLQYNGRRYGVPVQESGATILLWYLLGFLCCGIGPYIAMYFLIRNCNRICAAYNRKNGL